MATEQQIPKLTGALVEHQLAFASLTNEEAQWAILNIKVAIAAMVEAVKVEYNKVVSYITTIYTILVDETQTVEEAVKAGDFDWSNKNIISKNFPKPDNGVRVEKETALFHFGKTMSSEAVIAQMDAEGYRPATIWDLLGLVQKEPDLQRKFAIVALGSELGIGVARHVAVLCRGVAGRGLGLGGFDGGWAGSNRFLAVRK